MHLTYAGTSLSSQIRSYLLRSGSAFASLRRVYDEPRIVQPKGPAGRTGKSLLKESIPSCPAPLSFDSERQVLFPPPKRIPQDAESTIRTIRSGRNNCIAATLVRGSLSDLSVAHEIRANGWAWL